MAKLNASRRNSLPSSTFAGPKRSYPIPDASHARDALARSSGKPIAGKIRAAVAAKFPSIKISKKK